MPNWRTKRFAVYLLIAIVILPSLFVFVITRSSVLSLIAEGVLETELGRSVEVQNASWEFSGILKLGKIVAKADGLEGKPAELITIKNAKLVFESAFPLFNQRCELVVIEDVIVRVAESSKTAGNFNFSKESIPSRIDSTGESSSQSDVISTTHMKGHEFELPEIDIHSIQVETGTMDGALFELHGKKNFRLEECVDVENTLTFNLIEVNENFPISAVFDKQTSSISATLSDINLQHGVLQLLPRSARTWSEETSLNGSIEILNLAWSKENGFSVEADVQNIQFMLPSEHGVQWVSYKDSQLNQLHGDMLLDVEDGTIRFDGTSLTLSDIHGFLNAPESSDESQQIQFTSSIKIFDIPSIGSTESSEWMSEMLKKAPFTAQFNIESFRSNETDSGTVELPLQAAHMLKIFQLVDWSVSARVSVKRSAIGEDVSMSGDMHIKGASGVYEYFPYPLKDVNSIISFENEVIEIVSLKADGNEQSTVSIVGTVDASNDDLVVDLDLRVSDAPLDDDLESSLSKELASVMRHLLDEEVFETVKLRNENAYQSFELGGTINLDLHLHHDGAKRNGVEIVGDVDFDEVGIIHASFPFPVTLLNGEVRVNEEGIWINEVNQIQFVGPGKGVGTLLGEIRFNDTGGAGPNIQLSLHNEKITPELIESIAYSAGDSYETALSLLSGLGLDARLSVSGNFSGDGNGGLDTFFSVDIEDGNAVPNEQLAHAIRATSAFWPEGFALAQLKASLEIDNGHVMMERATAQCGEGSIDASLTLEKDDLELALTGHKLPLSNRFVNVLHSNASEKLYSAWNWLNPTGTVDVDMRVTHISGDSNLYLEVVPNVIEVNSPTATTMLDRERGSIVVENSNVFLNDLEFQFQSDTGELGSLEMMGEVFGSSDDFNFSINATLDKVGLSSPLTRSLTGIVGGEVAADYFDSIQPEGIASADLSASGTQEDFAYRFAIQPATLSATFHGHKAHATFDDSTKADVIVFDNDGIHFNQLSGALGLGTFSLHGSIGIEDNIHGDIGLTWDGPSNDMNLFAVLPKVIGETLGAIDLSGGNSKLPDGRLKMKGESWNALTISFIGDVFLSRVSVDVGIPLKDITGYTQIYSEYDGSLSELNINLDVDEMLALGRPLHDVEGAFVFDNQSNHIIFDQLRGVSGHGAVTVEGWLLTTDSKAYEVTVLVDGVDIGSKRSDDALATLQGALSGWITISGERSTSENRVGAGYLQITNGQLEVDPLSSTAVSLLNLALPGASTIEGADIELHINGSKMSLDDIRLTSSEDNVSDLEFTGDGHMDIDSLVLHARLHPRVGMPILRDLTGAINDQLYAIDVTGELLNPNVSVVPLPFLSPRDD